MNQASYFVFVAAVCSRPFNISVAAGNWTTPWTISVSVLLSLPNYCYWRGSLDLHLMILLLIRIYKILKNE